MTLIKHTCPACGASAKVHPAAIEVFHACPKKRTRGRPQPVTFVPRAVPA